MDALNGALPGGWVERNLGGLCEIQAGPSGAILPSREHRDKGTPVVRPADINDRRVSGVHVIHVDDTVAARLKRYRLTAGDIVCTRTGTLGRFALIASDQDGWLYSTQLLRIRPSGQVDPEYLVNYLAQPSVQRWVERHASGSTVRSVTGHTMDALPVALPPLEVQQEIGSALRTLDDKARLHSEISRATGEMREVLASMLMSGVVSTSWP